MPDADHVRRARSITNRNEEVLTFHDYSESSCILNASIVSRASLTKKKKKTEGKRCTYIAFYKLNSTIELRSLSLEFEDGSISV